MKLSIWCAAVVLACGAATGVRAEEKKNEKVVVSKPQRSRGGAADPNIKSARPQFNDPKTLESGPKEK